MDNIAFDKVELLNEAARIKPGFDELVASASTDEQVQSVLAQAHKIVLEDSEQAGI